LPGFSPPPRECPHLGFSGVAAVADGIWPPMKKKRGV